MSFTAGVVLEAGTFFGVHLLSFLCCVLLVFILCLVQHVTRVCVTRLSIRGCPFDFL